MLLSFGAATIDAPSHQATEPAIRPGVPPADDARLYRALFEHARGILVVLTPDGRVERANDAALALAGVPADAVAGQPLDSTPWWPGDPIAQQAIRTLIAGALAGRPAEQSALLGATAPIHADLTAQPLRETDGRIVAVLLEARDVTRRVEADIALRASEARFSGILGIAADAIISMDERMRIVHFNRGAEQIFGYTAAEIIGQPLELLLPDRFRTTHHHHVAGFAEAPETARRMGERREIFGRRRNGEDFPAEASISKLDVGGGERLFTVVLRDITDRKRLELNQRFIARASERLATSLDADATVSAIAALPVDFLADVAAVFVLEAPDRVRREVGPTLDPALAEAARAIADAAPVTPDDRGPVARVLRSGEPLLVADVDDAWMAANAAAFGRAVAPRARVRSLMVLPLAARDRAIGALLLARMAPANAYDATDLQVATDLASRAAMALENARLYQEAQAATRARDEVLGIVSHDLRNPLSAIAMCTRTVMEQLPEADSSRRELLRTAYDSTEWMHRLIQDLLDVTSIEAGRLAVERRDTDVLSVIERALSVFQRQAQERRIVLELDVPEPLPDIEADDERIMQVLGNLVGNALKFTGEGGRITVAATPHDGGVRIEVRDTGVGIPPEHLPHIFERYWQSRRTARKHGSGLGLAIARGIVEAHGGTIAVASTLGEGTTFTVLLPRR